MAAQVGDKVVFAAPAGPGEHIAWTRRRTETAIVVIPAQSADYYTLVYSPTERDTWAVHPGELRIVERATYIPMPELPAGGA